MFTIFQSLFGSKTDIKQLIAEGAIIVDVRTAQEFKGGHFNGSKNIPLDQVKNKIDEIKKLNKPIITVCQSGMRSATAKSILKAYNIDAYNGGSWFSLK